MPSSPRSMPSYRRWAIIMARFTLKRSLREASCWNLLVVNGAAGLRRRSRFSTERTLQSAFSTAVLIFSASSPLVIGVFSSPMPTNRAAKLRRLRVPAGLASIVQYSSLTKALISRSRSTIRRRATVCTRPAEMPRRTLSHKQRRNLVADQAIEHAAGLLRVHQVAIDVARMEECLLHGALGDLVEGDAADDGSRRSCFLLAVDRVAAEFLGQVSGDGFAFAVRVRRQIDGVGRLRQLLQPGDNLLFAGNDDVLGRRNRCRDRRRATSWADL